MSTIDQPATDSVGIAASSLPPVVLRAPSRYSASLLSSSPSSPPPVFAAPAPAWLLRTWTVTHSTLRMWRTAQNVRITYTAAASGNQTGNQDRVEYEDRQEEEEEEEAPSAGGKAAAAARRRRRRKVHVVQGANTADAATAGAFDWRGKGWLFFVTSHWEILGWGEVEVGNQSDDGGHGDDDKDDEVECECWVVTWFAPTVFTREGIDLYSSRRTGLRPATVAAIQATAAAAAAAAWPEPLAALVRDLLPVAIRLPWQE